MSGWRLFVELSVYAGFIGLVAAAQFSSEVARACKRACWTLLDVLFQVGVFLVVLLINGWTFACVALATLREGRMKSRPNDE
jgi:hypothetical protein